MMLSRLTALTLILLVPATASAQALADKVPGDSLVYVGWRGAADLGPGYDQSNLKAVLDDSDVRQFIDQFIPAVMDRIAQLNPQAGEVGKIVSTIGKPSWRHPTAFFFAGVEMGQNQPPMPHLGLLWQGGVDANALAQQLDQLITQVSPPIPVKVVRTPQLVALMVGYDNPEAALAAAANKPLANDDHFKAALSHVMKDPVAAFYLDYQRLLETMESAMKMAPDPKAAETWSKLRTTTGLNDLKRIVAASGFDGKDWGTTAFVEIPEPRHGFFKLITNQPIGDDILNAIPKTATTAGAGRADLSSLLDTIRSSIEVTDAQAGKDFDAFIDDITRQSGVNIRKDLLGSLGNQWAYFTDPSIGGKGLASITLVNRLKDPARFEESLSKIEDFALAQIAKQLPPDAPITLAFHIAKVDGMTIHYLGVPILAPSWVVHDGNLYVTAFPQVAAAAARRGNMNGSSILQNSAFAALRQRLGQASPVSFSFMDLPKTAPDAYGSWLVIMRLAGFADVFGVKSPPMLLPEFGKLMAHLAPAGSVSWVDAEGVHVRAIEPFPGSMMIASDPSVSAVYTYPVLLSIMLPALNRAREQANRIKSANNLRQIGIGAIMYANNHNGKFPADLGTMAKEEDLVAEVFLNPRSATGPPPPGLGHDQLSEWIDEHSGYAWLGAGKNVSAGADILLAYEKPERVSEGLNVLYADGHVDFLPMPEARREIDKARPGRIGQ